MKKKLSCLLVGLTFILMSSTNLQAQEPMLGEVKMFAGNFAPRGWAFCEGQLLQIAQNQALFSIVGTMYGGDGRTTFGLPDLRGRVAVGVGNGPGLSPINIGQKKGAETTTLNSSNLPAQAASTVSGISTINIDGGKNNQKGAQKDNQEITVLVPSGTPGSTPATTIKAGGGSGGGQSINNVQPSIGIRYIIALQGIFPSRS